MTEFKLPNLGDGVAAGDVLRVLVKVGDMLAVDQPVLELETDKATLEVPLDGRRHGHRGAGQAGRQGEARPGRAGGRRGRRVPPARRHPRPRRPPAGPHRRRRRTPGPAGRRPHRPPRMTGVEGRQPDRSRPMSATPPPWTTPPSGSDKVLAFRAELVRRRRRADRGPLAPGGALGAPARARARRGSASGAGHRPRRPHQPGRRQDVHQARHGEPRRRRSARRGHRVGRVGGAARLLEVGRGRAQGDDAASAARPRSTCRTRGTRFRTSRSSTRPTSPQLEAGAQEVPRRGREGRRQPHRHGDRRQGVASALKMFPQFNASVDAAGEAIVYKKYVQRRHRRGHRERPAGAGDPQRRPEEPHRRSRSSIQALAEKAKARKLTLDEMSGGVDVDLEPRRHRRHRVHADRQLAGSGDPRHLARRASSRCGTAPRSSRGRCCRCRSATTIG